MIDLLIFGLEGSDIGEILLLRIYELNPEEIQSLVTIMYGVRYTP